MRDKTGWSVKTGGIDKTGWLDTHGGFITGAQECQGTGDI